MTPEISIAGRQIGAEHPPFVIAEMSANHNGNLANAFKIIRAAKQAGADAVKLQTYRPETITLDCDSDDFRIQSGLWKGKTLYQLYAGAHMPWEWHAPLFDYAHELGITIFSSPFDTTAIDLLEDLNAPAYKIASFEAVDLALIRYAASTGKPLIISTGMASIDEISEAIATAQDAGCTDLAILHCVSGYPSPPSDYNLRTIPDLISRFGLVTGLSDHTLGSATAVASVALGGSIIEKHFTLDRNGGGPDDSFSLEPSEMTSLCRDVRSAWEAIGKVDYSRKGSERENVKFRRSLYVVRDVKVGERVGPDNVRSIRPGYGLPCRNEALVLNRMFVTDVRRGTPLSWDHLSHEGEN